MTGTHVIAHGDVLTVLRDLPDNTFDALFCDPPYGYSFMGKAWDYDVPSVDVWRECLRVLKPGAPLLSFGGSRTFHRIAVGIEDAGFELRDCFMWLYGKGFPKSQNTSKAIDKAAGAQVGVVPAKTINVTGPATDLAKTWDGYGSALKPAYEPIVLARKPLDGTTAKNVASWGVGALAIDACRIGWSKTGSSASENTAMSGANYARAAKPDADGRWPANLILDEEAGAALDASVAPTKSVPYRANQADGAVLKIKSRTAGGYSDAGGPSRFFYAAKVSTKEREYGCEALPARSAGEMTNREDDTDGLDSPRAGAGRGGGARNHHPTLKPLALNKWLASLIKPPVGGTLLIPYSGAGSEIIGALQAGWQAVFGIEGEAEYIEIAHARIAAWCAE